MLKIKDIYDRLRKNQKEYTELRFLVACRVFILVVSLYFVSILFTLGGFYIGTTITIPVLSTISFHLYSILIIAVVWFGFSMVEYGVAIYIPQKKYITYIFGLLLVGFGAIALFVHLNPLF